MAKVRDGNPKSSSSKKKKSKTSSKKLLSGPNVMPMKSQSSKDNPFETIWSRRKFDILGKKRKGEERRTGSARSLAIQKRKDTLLKEYKQSSKSSVFVDKRIGEQNNTLDEFGKAILRFQRERQLKVNKKSKYNLSDGEEEDDPIHGADPFSERDDFEDEQLALDDDDADADADADKKSFLWEKVNARDSGLVQGEENKHKSKKEVMEEIILKSKYFKAQKAKDKEENEELLEQLDKDFTSLVQSEALASLNQSTVSNSTYKNKLEQPDAYDKRVKEMALEMRARPSDRTKTPEEIAQEEKEHLERLEEERQKRMLEAGGSSDEGDDDQDDVNKAPTKKIRSISGDDLGDSFSFDEKEGDKKGWVDEILARGNGSTENEDDASLDDSGSDLDGSDEEEGSEDNDEPGKTTSLKDWEESDDDSLGTSLEEDEEEEDEEEEDEDDGDDEEEHKGREMEEVNNMHKSTDTTIPKSQKKIADTSSSKKMEASMKGPCTTQANLPYVIKEVPNSLDELCSLLDGLGDSEIFEVIHRIRVSNSIRLAAENRKKMQVFYGILLQYFAIVAYKKPLNLKLLNLLVKPLMEMSMETPYFAAICARQRILRTRALLCEDIKNPEKSCWPSVKTLSLLRLWSMIFPCSDFRHVVMTPAILLMCEYLMRCPIMSGRDIAIGTFLCSMVLAVTTQSKKFYPEAIIFLRALLVSALKSESRLLQGSQFYYLSEFKMLKPWLKLDGNPSDIHTLEFLTVMDMPQDSPFFSSDNFRTSVLLSVVETLRGFVDVYGGYNSFPEIFSPISTLLHEVIRQDNIPDTLQNSIKDVAQFINRKVDEYHIFRQPLQMRKQKPVPIKQLTPKFEENFVKGRDYDPDRERAEKKKLKKLLKQETRGAIRELRKDNYFLYEEKQKDRALHEEEKTENYGRARAFLQEQEHAFKSGQLGKGKGRKRRR